MVISLIIIVTTCINPFQPKGVIANIYSPRLIIGGKKLDWKKDFHIKFGKYSQVNKHPYHLNDVNTERTTAAIFLNSVNNDQGGYNFMCFTTVKVIVRYAWQEVPILSGVINQVK